MEMGTRREAYASHQSHAPTPLSATYYILVTFTDSTVPLLDAFTNALSFVGLWALARKYMEQWFFWIAVDVVCTFLYVTKGIPFKAGLYGIYVVIAVAGWFKWRQLMHRQNHQDQQSPSTSEA